MKVTVETLDKGLNIIKDYFKSTDAYEGVREDYHNQYQRYRYMSSKIKEVELPPNGGLTGTNSIYLGSPYTMDSAVKHENETNVINSLNYLDLALKNDLRINSTLITELYLQVTKNMIFSGSTSKNYKDYIFLKEITPISYGVTNALTEIEYFYEENIGKLNPIELAVRTHELYLKRFPLDIIGNGQTARAILNMILMINRIKPFIVTESNIDVYEETVLEDLIYGSDNFMEFILEMKLEEINNTLEDIRGFDMSSNVNKISNININNHLHNRSKMTVNL